jgi:hypothetical protein
LYNCSFEAQIIDLKHAATIQNFRMCTALSSENPGNQHNYQHHHENHNENAGIEASTKNISNCLTTC